MNKGAKDYCFARKDNFYSFKSGNKKVKLTLKQILDEFPKVTGVMQETKVRFCGVECVE